MKSNRGRGVVGVNNKGAVGAANKVIFSDGQDEKGFAAGKVASKREGGIKRVIWPAAGNFFAVKHEPHFLEGVRGVDIHTNCDGT